MLKLVKSPPDKSSLSLGSPRFVPTEDSGLTALTALYEREQTHRTLHRFALSLVKSSETAEDVVQEAFADTASKIIERRGNTIKHLGSYMRAVVHNMAVLRIRRQVQRPSVTFDEELDLPQWESTLDTTSLRHRCQDLYQAVEQLPSAQKSVFLMAELRGLSYREIASDMGRSEAAIRQLLSRARNRIRAEVGSDVVGLVVPILRLDPARYEHLKRQGSDLRHQIVAQFNSAHNALGSLIARSAEFVSHIAQPATALVAAAVVVSTVGPPALRAGALSGGETSVLVTKNPRDTHSGASVPAEFNKPDAGELSNKTETEPPDNFGTPSSDNDHQSSKPADRNDPSAGTANQKNGNNQQAKDPPTPTPTTPDTSDDQRIAGVITTGYDGSPADGPSGHPSVNAGGGRVAFDSMASNLVSADNNGVSDVFLTTPTPAAQGSTVVASVGLGDRPANGPSYSATVSARAPLVGFASQASNLVSTDSNALSDIFVRNYETSSTERVSLSNGGRQSNGDSDQPAVSADGRYVAFGSAATNLIGGDGADQPPQGGQTPPVLDTNGVDDIFVRDRQVGATERVSVPSAIGQANGLSSEPSISADGRYVAFTSAASNLVPGDSNGVTDVFVYDRQSKNIQRISQTPKQKIADGASSEPAISADGRYVVFTSAASNLVASDGDGKLDIYQYDRVQKLTVQVSTELRGMPGSAQASTGDDQRADCSNPSISGDGALVAFQCEVSVASTEPGGSPRGGVFVHNLTSGETRLTIALKVAEELRSSTLAPAIDSTGSVLAGVASGGTTPTDSQYSRRAIFLLKFS